MQAGRVPGQRDILVAWPAGNVLFPALLYASGFKAEFGYDDRKGVGRVIADPPGWDLVGWTAWAGPRSGKGGLKRCLATTTSKVSTV